MAVIQPRAGERLGLLPSYHVILSGAPEERSRRISTPFRMARYRSQRVEIRRRAGFAALRDQEDFIGPEASPSLYSRHYRRDEVRVAPSVGKHLVKVEVCRIGNDAAFNKLDRDRAIETVGRQLAQDDGVVHIGLFEEGHRVVATPLKVDVDDVLPECAVVSDRLCRAEKS